MMHVCANLNEIRQEMWPAERIKKCPLKYDLWPYNRRNTGGSIAKNNKRVDFNKIHIHTKFNKTCQETQLKECTQECEPK